MGLGRRWDSSDIRVPNPPARITAFNNNLPDYQSTRLETFLITLNEKVHWHNLIFPAIPI